MTFLYRTASLQMEGERDGQREGGGDGGPGRDEDKGQKKVDQFKDEDISENACR